MKQVLVVGDNTVVFNFEIEEDTPIDWDGSDFQSRDSGNDETQR